MKRLVLLFLVACGRENALVDGECAPGYQLAGGMCVPSSDPGGSDASPDGPAADAVAAIVPDAGSNEAAAADAASCDDGLTFCSGMCVDTSSDPLNCGACGVVCPSLLCENSACQGAVPGSLVVIGHNYGASYSGAQARLLGNTLLLSTAANIRVRSYEQYASAAAVLNVKAILAAAAAAAGRTVSYTVATAPVDVNPGMTALNTDVLLVYDQSSAPADSLAAIGAGWAPTIAAFTHVGGVVIALDGAGGANPQMPALIQSAGILDVTADTSIDPWTPLDVAAPSDAIGLGVVSPYGAAKRSVWFACNEPNGGLVTYVVEDPTNDAGSAQPVVVHKIAP